MKIKLIILMALLIVPITTAFAVTVSVEDAHTDFKKYCQYIVYGNGSDSDIYAGIAMGIIYTTDFYTPREEKTSLAWKADTDTDTIRYEACKNTLNSMNKNGFLNDFMWQTAKVLSTKYSNM